VDIKSIPALKLNILRVMADLILDLVPFCCRESIFPPIIRPKIPAQPVRKYRLKRKIRKTALPPESSAPSPVGGVGGSLYRGAVRAAHVGRLVPLLSDHNVKFNNLKWIEIYYLLSQKKFKQTVVKKETEHRKVSVI
jgi:hypothetical protein